MSTPTGGAADEGEEIVAPKLARLCNLWLYPKQQNHANCKLSYNWIKSNADCCRLRDGQNALLFRDAIPWTLHFNNKSYSPNAILVNNLYY
jgi:hypothetical protein